jgi:hypothetical protein
MRRVEKKDTQQKVTLAQCHSESTLYNISTFPTAQVSWKSGRAM